ncbi:MAG: class I SAM-dependent methyltransferase [Gaiellaceae bacterium]|jgi:ubiquinone/menaquinone biosynthesis C-methylase UbiE
MREYYDARAPEYDDWYLGRGLFGERERPGWKKELAALERTLASLPYAHTLDVACGTGFLTRHLPGELVGLDQSEQMLAIARERCPEAAFVPGDALALPFRDNSFERVFSAHFYGHLDSEERLLFMAEAERVAPELVICDAAARPDREPEELQERVLEDGSSWQVYKRFFVAEELAAELGGGEVLFAGDWFVVVRA